MIYFRKFVGSCGKKVPVALRVRADWVLHALSTFEACALKPSRADRVLHAVSTFEACAPKPTEQKTVRTPLSAQLRSTISQGSPNQTTCTNREKAASVAVSAAWVLLCAQQSPRWTRKASGCLFDNPRDGMQMVLQPARSRLMASKSHQRQDRSRLHTCWYIRYKTAVHMFAEIIHCKLRAKSWKVVPDVNDS